MNEEILIVINRNPGQAVHSVVKLFGIRIRGNSVYIFFGGLLAGVLLAMAADQVSILLAAMLLVAPAAAAVVFIRMFVANKPRGYFGFWLEERFRGSKLNPPQKAGGNHASA